MKYLEHLEVPTKEEQKTAEKSYQTLSKVIKRLERESMEIAFEKTNDTIQLPLKTLKYLADILKATSQGKSVSIVSNKTDISTQEAADILGCSRPHFVKLLNKGELEFIKVGNHRRVKYEDVITYKNRIKEKQKELIIKIMQADEADGLYEA